jgi:hypothetical protein
MAFLAISMDDYLKQHLASNPKENEKDLRKRLNTALTAYQNKIKCDCGNDIWVIGSASVGNGCFTCLTGESEPTGDYEIDLAIKKRKSKNGARHIDDIDPTKIAGFFTDDGHEINMDLIKKPSLCISCVHNDDPNEEMLCNLTRHDQQDSKEFICFAYKNIGAKQKS